MLGPAKTCTKLIIPFFDDLRAPGLGIPDLATLIGPAPS